MRWPIKQKNPDEKGLASIFVVGILIILLTLISMSFARIMDRTVKDSLNNETASAASYAAQSGINDLATYIKDHPKAKAEKCNDLLGDPSATPPTKGDFYKSSNLVEGAKYTCLLVNQRPFDIVYTDIPELKSRIVRLKGETAIDQLMFSWQFPGDRARDRAPPAAQTGTFPDENTWNSAPNQYAPVLRVTLYPVPPGGSISNIQTNSKTYFFYPNAGGVSTQPITRINYSAADGSTNGVLCGHKRTTPAPAPWPVFNGDADNYCTVIIYGLGSSAVDYYYARITPIYSDAQLSIKANDPSTPTPNQVRFKEVQAVLDVTARVGPSAKRLQARVDIAGTETDPSPNIDPEDNAVPEDSLRSANALCKRLEVHAVSPTVAYEFVDVEFNSLNKCRSVDEDIVVPNPAMAMQIATSPTPTVAEHPPDGWVPDDQVNQIPAYSTNPQHVGTSYIPYGGPAQMRWQTEDFYYCAGTSAPSIAAWNGNKLPQMTYDPYPATTANGIQSVGGLTSVTRFNLHCDGPRLRNQTKTVTAWPAPIVSIANASPCEGGSDCYNAGEPATVSWSSNNSTRCELATSHWGSVPYNLGDSGAPYGTSAGFATDWRDHSDKSFTITCWDPIGRSASASITLRASWPGGCSAEVNVAVGGSYSIQWNWGATCPKEEPPAGDYYLEITSTDGAYNFAGAPPLDPNGVHGSGSTAPNYFGKTICIFIRARAPSWGHDRTDGPKCASVPWPPISVVLLWDFHSQEPRCFDPAVPPDPDWHLRWLCGGSGDPAVPIPGTCADGTHSKTICWSLWSADAGPLTSSISCSLTSNGSGITSGGASGLTGMLGWLGPAELTVSCTYPGNPYGNATASVSG